MPDQKSQQDAAPDTALPAAGQAAPAAPVEDQSRMCCAVGDLSCVVPVVATPQAPPIQREGGDANQSASGRAVTKVVIVGGVAGGASGDQKR